MGFKPLYNPTMGVPPRPQVAPALTANNASAVLPPPAPAPGAALAPRPAAAPAPAAPLVRSTNTNYGPRPPGYPPNLPWPPDGTVYQPPYPKDNPPTTNPGGPTGQPVNTVVAAPYGPPPPGISPRAWKSFNEINSNISLAQWGAWDKELKGGCPDATPYAGRMGQCSESPDNCPDGYHVVGTPGQCVPGVAGGGAGGAGGAGGGGGGGYGGGDVNVTGNPVWDAILARLNQPSRYSDTTINSLMGQIKGNAEQGRQTQTDQYNQNLAARGLGRSSVADEGYRQINAGASNLIMTGKNDLLRAKVDADFADQTEAIKSGNEYLNSLRQYVASMAATQAQKEAHMAEINLGYAQLQQQLQVLREQYAQEMARLGFST